MAATPTTARFGNFIAVLPVPDRAPCFGGPDHFFGNLDLTSKCCAFPTAPQGRPEDQQACPGLSAISEAGAAPGWVDCPVLTMRCLLRRRSSGTTRRTARNWTGVAVHPLRQTADSFDWARLKVWCTGCCSDAQGDAMSVHVKPSIVVPSSRDSFESLTQLIVSGAEYHYYSLERASGKLGIDARKLPQSHKILLERMLAREDGEIVTKEQIVALADWMKNGAKSDAEIYVYANRVLLQDLTGGPLIGDLASMRDVMADNGLDPKLINPMVSVDLVVDHSVIVQASGSPDALEKNIDYEFRINRERFSLMKWTGATFNNVTVTPPGFGICHQQMIERLNPVIEQAHDDKGRIILSPSYLIGTDSHTTMAGALGIMAYGVGGIEAEATMLGQPLSLVIPDAVGVRLDNKLLEGITATDLALRITELLRQVGVVDKAVVFHGPGAQSLSLADRATISNMAPEYGATVGLFGIDEKTSDYLRTTGRSESQVALVEAYARAQGMWADANTPDPTVTTSVDLDLASITPCLSGPKQPKERVDLGDVSGRFWETFAADSNALPKAAAPDRQKVADFQSDLSRAVAPVVKSGGKAGELRNGDFVIAAI